MTIRPYKESDLPHLKQIHSDAGYDFPFPDFSSPFLGHVQVLVDTEDIPLMAVCSKLVPEITLLCAPHGTMHPLTKLKGIGLIHESMREVLTADGHDEAFAFVPPEIEKNYGRHLVRKFNWEQTWAAFRIGKVG
jgi:hypothetical protein